MVDLSGMKPNWFIDTRVVPLDNSLLKKIREHIIFLYSHVEIVILGYSMSAVLRF